MAHQGTSDRIIAEFSLGWLRAAWIGACAVNAERRRCRADQQYLATLNDYYLKDIGLDRGSGDPRSSRTFWYP